MIDLSKPLVTRTGRRVTIYIDKAAGDYPIQGCIHENGFDRIHSWSKYGSGDRPHGDDLLNYSLENNFPWDMLPGWANHCIFRRDGDWYCGSLEPEWVEEVVGIKIVSGCPVSRGYWKVVKNGAYYVLPEVVTKGILICPEDRESLIINPKYK